VELTIDDTTAHLTAPPDQARELLAWFHNKGVRCRLRPGGAIGGLDLLDFGNPSAADEQQIRRALAQWRAGRRG
jgi:hypothetical protein